MGRPMARTAGAPGGGGNLAGCYVFKIPATSLSSYRVSVPVLCPQFLSACTRLALRAPDEIETSAGRPLPVPTAPAALGQVYRGRVSRAESRNSQTGVGEYGGQWLVLRPTPLRTDVHTLADAGSRTAGGPGLHGGCRSMLAKTAERLFRAKRRVPTCAREYQGAPR